MSKLNIDRLLQQHACAPKKLAQAPRAAVAPAPIKRTYRVEKRALRRRGS